MIKEVIERIQSSFTAGQEDERMHVVKYLRREAELGNIVPAVASHLKLMASAFESKDHRK